ncbi:MAG TPA: CARDB domain-containing protein [Candidatus Tectomicrobia bacterium]|nr:CARDB domain-containing protein [Candidatus Tectomicrobia bacterium]
MTSLADSGPGTLRDAVSRGNRYVRFDVAGQISLSSAIYVRGAFITIDGFTAPSPGVTLSGSGLIVTRSSGAHDVIVRGIRVRDAADRDSMDCVNVSTYNVVLEHVSAARCADGGIDVGHGARNVTVAWSIVNNDEKSMLIAYGGHRITLHHNLIINGHTRNPMVTCESDDPTGQNVCTDGRATDTTVDMRNNIVWGWGDHGTRVRAGAWVNAVNNLFASPDASSTARARALIICRGDGEETPATLGRCDNGASWVRAYGYAAGNVSLDGVDLSGVGTVRTPFAAPPVTTTSACTGAQAVARHAGMHPLDRTDAALIGQLSLPSCSGEPEPTFPQPTDPTPVPSPPDEEPTPTPPPPTAGGPDLVGTAISAPTTLTRGVDFRVSYRITNQGDASAGESRTHFYLSKDQTFSSTDAYVRVRLVPALGPGQSFTDNKSFEMPTNIPAGAYYLLWIVDSRSAVKESNEQNNLQAIPVTVK